MKVSILFFILFFSSQACFAQSLEGEWKGYFTQKQVTSRDDLSEMEIIIQFHKINDTTFEGISKSIIKINKKEFDTAICILSGGFYEMNILYLEETRAIKKFAGENSDGCLQLMKLYYRKKKNHLELNGDWYGNEDNCGSGVIRLTKNL